MAAAHLTVPETRRIPAAFPHAPTWAVLGLLAGATVLSRLPFLTPRLAHWDAVNYALGLHDFNVAAHQPHPPGSPYFILVGRVALAVLGDDNAALIAVSLLAAVGAVLGEYALARLLFGRRAGGLAALVLLTQPVFWGYGTMGMPWTLLGCLALGIGLVCLLLMHGRRWLVLPSALLLGIASGFRLDATVFLAPLWLWSVCKAEPQWRRRLLAIGLVGACILVWLVPVSATTGGLSTWYARLLALLPATDTSPGPAARQLAANTAISFGTLAVALGPLVLLSLLCDPRATSGRSAQPVATRSDRAVFWGLWIIPAFVFLWLVDSTEPGHALIFSVAVCAFGAGLLAAATHSLRRLLLAGTVVVAVQVGVFLFGSPLADRPLAWTVNSMLLNVTAPGLRQQQTSLDDALRIVHAQFDPGDTVIVTVIGEDAYRFMMYYLPDYLVVRLDPAAHSLLPARGKQQGTWTSAADCLFDTASTPRSIHHAVWVLSANPEPGVIPIEATHLSPSDDTGPFQVWALRPGPQTPDYLGFTIGGGCTAG
jgi:hypothetical protein